MRVLFDSDGRQHGGCGVRRMSKLCSDNWYFCLAYIVYVKESRRTKKCHATGMSEVITTTKVYTGNMIFSRFYLKRPIWLLVSWFIYRVQW